MGWLGQMPPDKNGAVIPRRAQLYMGFMLVFYSIQRFVPHNHDNMI